MLCPNSWMGGDATLAPGIANVAGMAAGLCPCMYHVASDADDPCQTEEDTERKAVEARSI